MCCISVLACTVCNMCTAWKQTTRFFLSLDEHDDDDDADGYSVFQARCPVAMFWSNVQCTWFDIKNCHAKILSNIFRAWFSRTCSLLVIHIFSTFLSWHKMQLKRICIEASIFNDDSMCTYSLMLTWMKAHHVSCDDEKKRFRKFENDVFSSILAQFSKEYPILSRW